MIFFNEEAHRYNLDSPEGPECISVTTLIGLFKSEYNSNYWSYYHALRKLRGEEKPEYGKVMKIRFKYFSTKEKDKSWGQQKFDLDNIALSCGYTADQMELAQQEVLYEWKKESKKATDKGTKFHNWKEEEAIKNGGVEYEKIHVNLATQTEDLANLHHPTDIMYIPELRMYNREYLISGTSDVNYIYPNKTVQINDWKTNKKIDTNNPFGDKMEYPLQDLDCCNHTHYKLQISVYAWMLEQWGYKPTNLKFTHIVTEEDGLTIKQATEYHFDYMKQDVENMLNYYRNNKQMLLAKYKK